MSKPIFLSTDCKILLVSNDTELLATLEFAIVSEKYQYDKTTHAKDAVIKLRNLNPSLVIIDLKMTSQEIEKITNPIRRYKKYSAVKMLFLLDEQNADYRLKNNENLGEYYLEKPIDLGNFKKCVRQIFGF